MMRGGIREGQVGGRGQGGGRPEARGGRPPGRRPNLTNEAHATRADH